MRNPHQKLIIKTLLCGVCGYARQIPRKERKNKREGHHKPMFCPQCRRRRIFVETDQ